MIMVKYWHRFLVQFVELRNHTRIRFTAKAAAANTPSTIPIWPSCFTIPSSLFLHFYVIMFLFQTSIVIPVGKQGT